MSPNRREFIKFVVAGSIAAGCPMEVSLLSAETAPQPQVDSEDNRICHKVRDGEDFPTPAASARHDFVIVGGGISGLTAAYLLRNHDFLLLEKEAHWGGNAYLMDYQGSAYATGAAFIWSGDSAYPFAKEIGLEPLPINNWDGTIVQGEFVPDTWGEGLDKLPYPATVRESFKKFRKDVLAIDFEKREKELYQTPASDLMKDYAPEVKHWWDAYGPSNWGAVSDDTPLAQVVEEFQFFAGDKRQDVRYAWPGGNGVISKRLAEILQTKSAERMVLGATTTKVIPHENQVDVTYLHNGEPTTVAAKAVIMATPKFITRRIVQGIPEPQRDAMHAIRYIPYPVVNLIFDKPVFHQGYDTWCPGNTFTDFIVADWVVRNQPGYRQNYNILTCYTPLKEEERARLLTEQGTQQVAAQVLTDFQRLFPGSSVDPVEVHIYRRGHPMYMCTPGLFTKVQPITRRPMDRVFFANTDSEGPESTTSGAISAAQRAVMQAEHRLAGKPMTRQTAMAG